MWILEKEYESDAQLTKRVTLLDNGLTAKTEIAFSLVPDGNGTVELNTYYVGLTNGGATLVLWSESKIKGKNILYH